MNSKAISHPLWSTASFEDSGDSLPMELHALGRHTQGCRGGRMFTLRSGAESAHRFVVSRFVTTLVAITLLIGAGLLVL